MAFLQHMRNIRANALERAASALNAAVSEAVSATLDLNAVRAELVRGAAQPGTAVVRVLVEVTLRDFRRQHGETLLLLLSPPPLHVTSRAPGVPPLTSALDIWANPPLFGPSAFRANISAPQLSVLRANISAPVPVSVPALTRALGDLASVRAALQLLRTEFEGVSCQCIAHVNADGDAAFRFLLEAEL